MKPEKYIDELQNKIAYLESLNLCRFEEIAYLKNIIDSLTRVIIKLGGELPNEN